MLNTINAYRLHWNPITIDGYNENKNEIIMIFNCDITSDTKRREVIKYVIGRTIWCCQNILPQVMIILSFDIRGQGIIINKSNLFKTELLTLLNDLNVDNHISIDFLR